MTRSIRLPALSLALLAAALAAAAQDRRVSDADQLERVVGAEARARTEARQACAANPLEVVKRVAAGTAQAEAEATAAAERNCFGMITTVNGIPSGVSYAPGVECRPNERLFVYGRLMRLFFAPGTDVLSFDPAESERFRDEVTRMREYALAYNAAVVSHPDFPYNDLCRRASAGYRPDDWPFEQLEPFEWGFRPLAETDQPRDMYEAARRGSVQGLRRSIGSDPIDMYSPDVLGLTPLAWAVIYERPAHMRILLEAGAHPYGEPYWDRPQETSPIMIALKGRKRELTAIMRPALEVRGLPLPELPAKLDAARSQPVDTGPMTFELAVSPTGLVADCRLLVGDARFEYPVTCDRIRESTVYLPAEDASGDPVATTVLYRAR